MLVRDLYFGLFLIFLVTSSVYVFDPGTPQPADFLMASLVGLLATGFIITPPVRSDLVFVGALFVLYAALVNLFWFLQFVNDRFLWTALYYAFDLGALMVVVSLVKAYRERFITPCQIAIVVAIVLEVLAIFLLPRTGIRSLGTFNNANQLGFWGLAMGCSWLLLKRDQRLTAVDILVLCGAGYLAAESLSKAAMLSFVLLLILGIVFQRLSRSAKFTLIAMGFAATAQVLLDPGIVERLYSIDIVQRVDNRLDSLGEQGDDSLAGRGYDRIWRHPEHLLFGAGEGELGRFTEPLRKTKEMHSTLGTVLFSYGIIGLALFCTMVLMVFRRAPRTYAIYSLPIWSFGMTHQGLRDTMLWVFLGMAFGLATYARSQGSRQTAAPFEAPSPADHQVAGLRPRSAGR